MPETKTCPKCKGAGGYYALISQHGDEKEYVDCPYCKGKAVIHEMTEREEQDYWDDYW